MSGLTPVYQLAEHQPRQAEIVLPAEGGERAVAVAVPGRGNCSISSGPPRAFRISIAPETGAAFVAQVRATPRYR